MHQAIKPKTYIICFGSGALACWLICVESGSLTPLFDDYEAMKTSQRPVLIHFRCSALDCWLTCVESDPNWLMIGDQTWLVG